MSGKLLSLFFVSSLAMAVLSLKSSSAQNLSELIRERNNHIKDSVYVDVTNIIADSLLSAGKMDTAIGYLNDALAIGKSIDYAAGIARTSYLLGRAFTGQSKYLK